MKAIARISLFCLLWFAPLASAAVQDVYRFQTPAQQQQFQQLTEQLRCLVCQNQNLADSNAPLAHDLRQKVAALVNQQRPNSAIIAFLVQRYGDFVLYDPPLTPETYVLWFAPLLLLFGGACLLGIFIHRQSRARRTPAP